ncbi:MAG TPA: hypothetical protein ENH41_04605, partial [Candidatus Omnitrophica bacterium]|nr:hypothetical protein [Candidatus Omnitrophota bacterium]
VMSIFYDMGTHFAMFLDDISHDFGSTFPKKLLITGRITRELIVQKDELDNKTEIFVDSGKAFLSGITQTIESRFPHLQDLEIIFPDDVVADKELREFAQAYGTIYLANQKLKEGNPKQSNAPNGKTTDSPIDKDVLVVNNNFIDHMSYEDKLRLNNLKDNLYSQELYEIIPVEKEVIKYIKARAPPKSVYDKLVFFLERGQIKFYTLDDLTGSINFPRKIKAQKGIRYFNSYGEKTHYIHVTKTYYNSHLRGNTELAARLIFHFWVERFLPPPYMKTRHQYANEKEKALVDPSERGLYVSEETQKKLDKAVEDKNQDELLDRIDRYDIRRDPDTVYQQALYEAVKRLEKKLGHLTIRTGKELLAWHRYMIEGTLREDKRWKATDIVSKISDIIRKGIKKGWIRKILLYRNDSIDLYEKDLTKYDYRYMIPYSHNNYHDGKVVFIPQCPIEWEDDVFNYGSINLTDDKKSLESLIRGIEKKAIEENSLTENVKAGLTFLDEIWVIKEVLGKVGEIVSERRFNEDRRAVVVGILAPGGAGKTTFAETFTLAVKAIGLKSGYVGADAYLHPGSGFRYDTAEDGYRDTHIWGPGIYNDIELWRVLNHLKEGKSLIKAPDEKAMKAAEEIGPDLDMVVTDGVFMGLDKQLSEVIDILVSIYVDRNEVVRLEAKIGRDMVKGSMHKGIEIILDFSEKQHHETKDGVRTLILERSDFVWLRGEYKLYYRRTSSPISTNDSTDSLISQSLPIALKNIKTRIDLFGYLQTSSPMEKIFKNKEELRSHIDYIVVKINDFLGRLVIYLGGPSCAGKSFISDILQDILNSTGRESFVLNADHYFKPLIFRPRLFDGRPADSPDSLYIDWLATDIKLFLDGKEIHLPKYDFQDGMSLRYSGKKAQLNANGVLIVDSHFAFDNRLLEAGSGYPSKKIFIDASKAIRFRRRIKREYLLGENPINTISRWDTVVLSEREFIYPYRSKADFILSFAGSPISTNDSINHLISQRLPITFALPNFRTGIDGYTWGKKWRESEILITLGIIDEEGNITDEQGLKEIAIIIFGTEKVDSLSTKEIEDLLDKEDVVIGEIWLGSDDEKYPAEVDLLNEETINLFELLELKAEEILGKAHVEKYGHRMATIMKIIDARESLSAQLHSAILIYIMKKGKKTGVPPKPEMWMFYKQGGTIYFGWSKDMSEEELIQLYAHSRSDFKEYLSIYNIDRGIWKFTRDIDKIEENNIKEDKDGLVFPGSFIVITKENKDVWKYIQEEEGVSLIINNSKKYFYPDTRIELTTEQKKASTNENKPDEKKHYRDILLLRNLFEQYLNKIELTPDKPLIVRGGMVHAIRGDTTLIEFSIAPSKAIKGNLDDATISFGDSLDKKRPRNAKEDLANSTKVFNKNPSSWEQATPDKFVSRPKTIKQENNNIITQLFSKETGVEVYQIDLTNQLTFKEEDHGYPIYILKGSIEIRAPDNRVLTTLSKSQAAIIPAYLKEYTLTNTSDEPSVIMKWNAPVSSPVSDKTDKYLSDIWAASNFKIQLETLLPFAIKDAQRYIRSKGYDKIASAEQALQLFRKELPYILKDQRNYSNKDALVNLYILRELQKKAVFARPIISTKEPRRDGWGGEGNEKLHNFGAPGKGEHHISQVCMNSVHDDHFTRVKDTNLTVKSGKTDISFSLPDIDLREIYSMNDRDWFIKTLAMRFPRQVDWGLNQKKIASYNSLKQAKSAYIELFQNEKNSIKKLLKLFRKDLTAEKFNEFREKYIAWGVRQATSKRPWKKSIVIKGLSEYFEDVDKARTILNNLKEARAGISEFTHTIPLKDGIIILVPTGTSHAILGLSIQFHPITGETKTESWAYIPVYDEKGRGILKDKNGEDIWVLFEPQELSDTTYSPADLFATFEWDKKKDRPKTRKPLKSNKEIAKMINTHMNFTLIDKAEYILEAKATKNPKIKSYIDDVKFWPLYSQHEIVLNKNEVIDSINDNEHDLFVARGMIEIIVKGDRLKMEAGEACIIDKAMDKYKIRALSKKAQVFVIARPGEVRIKASSPVSVSSSEDDSIDAIVSNIVRTSAIKITREMLKLAIKFFKAESTEEIDELRQGLMRFSDVRHINWTKNKVLSIYTGEGMICLHKRGINPIELLGLSDRIYLEDLVVKVYKGDFYYPDRPIKSPFYVLGISGSWHDSCAALFKDAKLIAALEEERITRTKHDMSVFPENAIRRLLEDEGINLNDIQHIAIGWNYNWYLDMPHSRASSDAFFDEMDRAYAKHKAIPIESVIRRPVPERNKNRFKIIQLKDFLTSLAKEYKTDWIPYVSFVHHHQAHAACAYYPSGFKDRTLVVTIDGYGDGESASVWIGDNADLELVMNVNLPNSLGWTYTSITEYLGFKPNSGEGEVMGYAPYGKPRNAEEEERVDKLRGIMQEYIQINYEDGLFYTKAEFYYYGNMPESRQRVTQEMIDRISEIVPPSQKSSKQIDANLLEDRPYVNLAYVLQERIEEAVLAFVGYYLRKDIRTKGIINLCLAGGIELNVLVNGKIIDAGLVDAKHLFVPPVPSDQGTAIGAAMVLLRDIYCLNPSFKMEHAAYGPKYSEEEIRGVLDSFGLKEGRDFVRLGTEEEIAKETARLIIDNRVVAWFQGSSEIGPRALGNRSILLNATDYYANVKANKIKLRQPWRPSAVTISEEDISNYLINADRSPFMVVAFRVVDDKAHFIASGRHQSEDGRARPQTVSKKSNYILWRLLNILQKESRGEVVAVVNTSFNRQEPLVESPEEALNTFYYMKDVDVLFMGNFLVRGRKSIKPSILSLGDEPETELLIMKAKESADMEDWAKVFECVSKISKSNPHLTQKIILKLDHGYFGHESIEIPLVKEMFEGNFVSQIQRYIVSLVYNRIIEDGTRKVYIGTTSKKMRRVIFNILKTKLEQFANLRRFGNFGSEILILSLEEYLAPDKTETDMFASKVFFPSSNIAQGTLLGVDVGGTNIKSVVIKNNSVIYKDILPTVTESGEALKERIKVVIAKAKERMRLSGEDNLRIDSLGISLPGVVRITASRQEVIWLVSYEAHWQKDEVHGYSLHYAVLNHLIEELKGEYPEAEVAFINDVNAFGVIQIVIQSNYLVKNSTKMILV